MGAIDSWFWAIALVVMAVNGLFFWVRARDHIEEDPTLKPGYHRLAIGYFGCGSVPGVVMGLGVTIGGVPTVWHFFRPQDGNPWVLAFFATIFMLWTATTYWIIFGNGATEIVKHPGLFRSDIKSPLAVKAIWLLCLAGGMAAVIMMALDEGPSLFPS